MGLYRDAFDYQSAAIMQFDIAAAYQQLNDADDALAALKAAVAMDREYGFRKDAEDNTRLLLQWQGQSADDSDVAAAMKDFPTRTADFKFNWHDNDADVAVHVDETSLIQGKVIHNHGAITLTRHVRTAGANWAVTNERGTPDYDPGDWPADAKVSEWSMLYFIAAGLLEAPNIEDHQERGFQDRAGCRRFRDGPGGSDFRPAFRPNRQGRRSAVRKCGEAERQPLSLAGGGDGGAQFKPCTPGGPHRIQGGAGLWA